MILKAFKFQVLRSKFAKMFFQSEIKPFKPQIDINVHINLKPKVKLKFKSY